MLSNSLKKQGFLVRGNDFGASGLFAVISLKNRYFLDREGA